MVINRYRVDYSSYKYDESKYVDQTSVILEMQRLTSVFAAMTRDISF